MLVAAGNINQPYKVLGMVHAIVSRSPKSAGFGQPKVMPVEDAYTGALGELVRAAKKSGADGLIHVSYEHRVAVASKSGCSGTTTEQVFELYAWGTAVSLGDRTGP